MPDNQRVRNKVAHFPWPFGGLLYVAPVTSVSARPFGSRARSVLLCAQQRLFDLIHFDRSSSPLLQAYLSALSSLAALSAASSQPHNPVSQQAAMLQQWQAQVCVGGAERSDEVWSMALKGWAYRETFPMVMFYKSCRWFPLQPLSRFV